MTEQPPSASKEALDLAERIRDWQTAEWVGAKEIDALCEQRVSAERKRLEHLLAAAIMAADNEASMEWALDYWQFVQGRPHQHNMASTCHACVRDEYQQKAAAVIRAPGERPAPEDPQQQDSLRGIGVEQPTQETRQPGCGTEARGPETQRLIDRLVAKGTKNFSVSWGPDAHKLTAEQRAAEINRALDAVADGDYEEITDLDDRHPVPPTGRVELGERSNTESSQTTTPAAPPLDWQALLENVEERHSGYLNEWLKDPEFRAALHRYDRPSAAVPDYTERAQSVLDELRFEDPEASEPMNRHIIMEALSAVASEHKAAPSKSAFDLAKRAREEVAANWRANEAGTSDVHPDLLAMIEQAALNAITRVASEHQAEITALKHDIERTLAIASAEAAGHSEALAKLARLREPEIAEQAAKAAAEKWNELGGFPVPSHHLASTQYRNDWRQVIGAALTKIAEMLT